MFITQWAVNTRPIHQSPPGYSQSDLSHHRETQMRGCCQLHHLLPAPHLLMLTKRALVSSNHGFSGHIPGVTDFGGCSSPVPINLLLSMTHSHIFLLIFFFFCPLESILVLLYLFFSSNPFCSKGLKGWLRLG